MCDPARYNGSHPFSEATLLPHSTATSIALTPDFAGTWDVVIIGSGAAGLYAALSFPDRWRVLLLTKETLPTSSSSWAQGGIAAVTEPDDTPELHAADTLRAGAGLCEPAAVDVLVREAGDRIAELLRWGVEFDRAVQAGDELPDFGPMPYRLAVTLEAAHSRRRVLHVADATGKALVQKLLAKVLASSNIDVWERSQIVDVWLTNGRCGGAYGLRWDADKQRAQTFAVSARATVLATGGAGQLFTHTTNPTSSTGDGQAIAWRAGAALRDLEFVQFHPTALMVPGAPRFLISEAVRGEGAYLVDATGRRFAFDYHADGELAPRDVVSRAIFQHLKERQPHEPDCVWLDLRHLAPATVRHRFPTIAAMCHQYGVDLYTQPVPVAPAAHYWMGGIETDLWGRTSVPGLYAVGEVASTGVHGANRLASNSLLECLVFAHRLADVVVATEAETPPPFSHQSLPPISLHLEQPERWARSLAEQMWQAAGICRHAQGLQAAIATVEAWFSAAHPTASASERSLPSPLLYRSLDLRSLIDTSLLLLHSVAFRTESRGGHYREDYPHPDPRWQVHTRWIGHTPTKDPLDLGQISLTPSLESQPPNQGSDVTPTQSV